MRGRSAASVDGLLCRNYVVRLDGIICRKDVVHVDGVLCWNLCGRLSYAACLGGLKLNSDLRHSQHTQCLLTEQLLLGVQVD